MLFPKLNYFALLTIFFENTFVQDYTRNFGKPG